MAINLGALDTTGNTYITQTPDALGSVTKGYKGAIDLDKMEGDLQTQREGRKVIGNLPALMQRAKENKNDFDAVSQLAQHAPGVFAAIKASDEYDADIAAKRKEEIANNLGSAYAFIQSAESRKMPKDQAWSDVMQWNRAHGLDMGSLADEPYSDMAMSRLKTLVIGTKALAEQPGKFSKNLQIARDANGNLVYVQASETGGAEVVSGLKPAEGVMAVSTGGGTELVGSKTGETVRSIGKGLSAAESAALDPERQARLAEAKAGAEAKARVAAGQGASAASEDERKAAGWLSQARTALGNMQDALRTDPRADTPGALEGAAELVGAEGALQSEARQRYATAASSFAEAALRAATGAGVTESEAKQKIRELTPRYFDKPATKQQKWRQLQMYIDSLEQRAGRAARPAQKPATGVKPSSAPKAKFLGFE